jgi:hypothetical protein
MIESLKQDEGGYYTPTEVLKVIGVGGRQALEQRRKRGQIVSWSTAGRRYFYPKWQFQPDGKLLEGIAPILKLLAGGYGEWMVMQFFLARPPARGGERILDMLREGRVEEALNHARANSPKAHR